MDLPVIVHAEAVLWSRSTEAGFTSILDPQAQITAQNLKKFYADPAKVKAAVDLLKKHGFSVYSVGKTSISVGARPEIYEKSFDVTLSGTEIGSSNNRVPIISVRAVKNSQKQASTEVQPTSETDLSDQGTTRIDTVGTAFQGLLVGMILSQPSTLESISPTPPQKTDPTNQVYPEDLRRLLGGTPQTDALTGEGITVFVVDSGCDSMHPFFSQEVEIRTPDGGKQTVRKFGEIIPDIAPDEIKIATNSLIEKKRVMEELKNKRSLVDEVKSFVAVFGGKESDIDIKIDNLNAQIQYLEEFINYPEKDCMGHGTEMVASLFAIAPRVNVCSWKVDTNGSAMPTIGHIRDIIRNKIGFSKNKTVVSCSFSQRINSLDTVQPPDRLEALCELAKQVPVLFAAGNYREEDQVNLISWQASLPEVISVGGAYIAKKDDKVVVTASDASRAFDRQIGDARKNGYYRRVPDICGWCSAYKDELLILPAPENSRRLIKNRFGNNDGWSLGNGGTSSANAQVAGICAIIKQIWPEATPEAVKAILIKSGDEITDGYFAFKKNLKNLGGFLVYANIGNAVKTISIKETGDAEKVLKQFLDDRISAISKNILAEIPEGFTEV